MEDLKSGNLKRSFRKDLKEIYYFYIDEDRREQLQKMGRFRRWFWQLIWILKSLLLNLTPLRRLLLVLSMILFLTNSNSEIAGDVQIQLSTKGLGFFILLFVLALELKDKLLAHDELETGRKVQMALMPESNPKLKGWEIWMITIPANQVGGDLVDYLELDNNRLGIALGDVAGKGLGAALFMTKIQATIRALAPNMDCLAEFAKQLNTIFYRDSLPNSFATLIYLEIGENQDTVQLLNAGHLPPLIIDGESITEMKAGSPALGMNLDVTYQKQSTSLPKGSILFLFSDGLTEARNTEGEFFGDQRLIELLKRVSTLSVPEMGKQVVKTIESFIGDGRYYDDFSVVILKRKGNQ
jgi:serine phosphatase RsbU (regulator of sigma subunit)